MLQHRAVVDAAVEIKHAQILDRRPSHVDTGVGLFDVVPVNSAHIVGHVTTAMGDADFKSRERFQHTVIHQRRECHRLLKCLPDAVPEVKAFEAAVTIAPGWMKMTASSS